MDTPGGYHRGPGCISLSELRGFPGLEFLRLRIEPRDDTLIHRALPDVSIAIDFQIERALRFFRLHHRHRILYDFAGFGIELAHVLRTEVGIPHHSLRVDHRVVRHRFGPRQIVLRDNDVRRFTPGPGHGLQFVRPFGIGTQIDRGGILGLFYQLALSPWRRVHISTTTPGADSQLRPRRRAALSVARHAPEHLDEFGCVVLRSDDALQGMTAYAAQKDLFLFPGSRHAHHPLSVRELSREVLRLDQL